MTNSSTKKYAFVLGRERDLCLVELRAVLGRFGFCFADLILSDNVAIFNLDKDPRELIDIFGGTTKIFEIIESDGEIKDITGGLISKRAKSISGKINFGFSAYGRHRANQLNALGLNIKKELKSEYQLRFIALKEKELSTIVSSKNKLATEGLEVGFFNDAIGILIAVTDPEAWSERDYGKPRGDRFSGMVPPKLARIMVNLALGEMSKSECQISNEMSKSQKSNVQFDIRNLKFDIPQAPLIVDPFCGSGNILLEAMMLGCDVFGSDISEKAVIDSQENVSWLMPKSEIRNPNQRLKPKVQISKLDAAGPELIRHLKFGFSHYDDLVIVTEPYLGEPKKYLSSIRAVRGEYEKVKELYLSFLSNLGHLSNMENVVLCLVFPLVETAEKVRYSLYAESVDEIRKIGYTELAKPLVYGRDYQVVKREIALLKL